LVVLADLAVAKVNTPREVVYLGGQAP
jgi:hypothetical protein